MGLESPCTVIRGTERIEGKALLETDELVVRGDARQKIPLASITSVDAAGGRLRITSGDQTVVLELGAAAEKWAERIRSPRSLLDKLGVTPGARVALVGVRDAAFERELASRNVRLTRDDGMEDADLVFLAAAKTSELEPIAGLASRIRKNAAIWVIHPKGKGGLPDTEIFRAAKSAGLTATKVARFSATHSAEKLVIPGARR